jgi:hypothetical protein
MAKGKAFGRINRVFGLIGLIAIVVTYSIITGWNPLPGWANWVQNVTVRKLATPGTAWTVRAGDEPRSATVLNRAIIVSTEGSVEARDPSTGAKLWTQADSWAGVAGGVSPVVVVGRPVGSGFDVYDPVSGIRLWQSNGKAGVWTYADMILTLTCSSGSHCTLRSLDPGDGKPRWKLDINGPGGPLLRFDQSTPAIVPVASDYAPSIRALPAAAPELIGLPMGGRIHVISTKSGTALHVFTPSRTQRTVVAPKDVITSTAELHGNQCYYSETGNDPATGEVLWQHTNYNLRTSSGLGCDQRHDPTGGGDKLLATDTAGRDVVLSASSGKQVFRADAGEHVVAMDASVAITRIASGKTMRAIDLSSGKVLWTQPTNGDASIGIAPQFVLVADPRGPGKLLAYARSSGQPLLDVVSGSTVLGIGDSEIIVNIGRTLGPLSVGSGP